MFNWSKIQCYLRIILLSNALFINVTSTEEQQILSNILNKIYQNPYYFYNLNTSPFNPAFNRFGLISSPASTYMINKPAFSVQIKPEHQLQHEQTFLTNNPSRFYLQTNDHPSLYNQFNHQNNHENKFLKPNQYEQNRRNQIFYNRIGVNENGLQTDFIADPNAFRDTFSEQNRPLIIGHWCNKQMQKVLEPYCFCGRNRMTKNTVICSNVLNELALRRTLHAAAILLNIEGIHRINKLRIFNSTIDDLNLQTFPKTVNFMLIQMNKCELHTFDQLNLLHNSMNQIKKLDLSSNELEEFPFKELYQLNDLLILKLSYNKLSIIPDDSFQGCTKLKMLDLSFNQLNYLGNHAFTGALNLKFLNLRYNQLKVLNNHALAFQPSSIVYFINLSDNQMKLISDNAFDGLIVHRLYLNNNRLKKFPQILFEPILNSIAKINIEKKIFYGEDLNHYETNQGLADLTKHDFNEQEINYRNNKINRSNEDKSERSFDSSVDKQTKLIKLDEKKNSSSDHQIKLIKDHLIHLYSKYLNDNFLSINSSISLSSNFSFNNSTNKLINNFDNELNILLNLNLDIDLFEQLSYDLILNDFNLTRFKYFDKSTERKAKNWSSNDSSNYFDSKFELDPLFYSQQSSNQESIDSFREEIKPNKSQVYFDDEQDQKIDFSSKLITNLNFENDENTAFIDVSDNDFQCNCKHFEWLFNLKKSQLRSLKGFHCANLPGQKKFLNLDQLTLSDINCWNLY